jgi:viroplasmin and RNaseH domain-containing protein
MEASCKIFINDLENILKKQYGVSYDLYKQNEETEVKNILSKYIQKNLAVQIDAKNISFTLLGSEREDAALWIYLESAKISTPKRIEINNTLLFDLFEDQSNIVHYEQNGQRKSYKLSNPNGKVIF